MRMIGTAWPLSSILLIVAAVALSIVGLYFILVRPSLLPEDMRYMALPAAQLDAVRPQLETWLAHVFQVTGVLIGGAASVGWMTVVNFVIRSDFKWFLLGLSLLWAVAW